MDIFIGSSFDSKTINTPEETESGSILSSSVTATESSSIESEDESDKDIETEIDDMSLNN
jgi:hypothetical protein